MITLTFTASRPTLYRRMVRHAEKLAAEGVDVAYKPRAPMPAGDNPTFYNTPEDPAEARAEMRAA